MMSKAKTKARARAKAKQRPVEHIYLSAALLTCGASKAQMFADSQRRWWRRVDENTISMVVDGDQYGRYSQFIVQCPDCDQWVESPRLRSLADVERLMDSDLTEHHRCAALERN